jgi:hypothetical protein
MERRARQLRLSLDHYRYVLKYSDDAEAEASLERLVEAVEHELEDVEAGIKSVVQRAHKRVLSPSLDATDPIDYAASSRMR